MSCLLVTSHMSTACQQVPATLMMCLTPYEPANTYDYGTSANRWHISAVDIENKLRSLDATKGFGSDVISPA